MTNDSAAVQNVRKEVQYTDDGCTRVRGRGLRRAWALAALVGLAGCSFVLDWANPGSVYDSMFGDDVVSSPAARADDKAPGEEDEFPSLEAVPDRPTEVSSLDERDAITEGLIADREGARYTDEILRSGPSDAPSAEVGRLDSASSEPEEIVTDRMVSSTTQPLVEEVAPTAPSRIAEAESLYEPIEPNRRAAVAEPLFEEVPSQARAELRAGATMDGANRMDSSATVVVTRDLDTVAQTFAMRLAESGGTVSTAPANPSFSSPQTGAAIPEVTVAAATTGGREPMEATGAASGVSFSSAKPTAIVKFANGSDGIRRRYRDILKRVVADQRGSGAFIRVVGHASSRTRDLPLAEHMLVNFQISVERADAVARELIRLGAPAASVFTEARSDAEPLYYEIMPAGEDENRRAEIFLEY